MSGQILIHIGLPKTATTALQKNFYPLVADETLKYVGVFQLRESQAATKLYHSFYNAVSYRKDIEYVRQQLSAEFRSNVSVLISEEMFTVSQSTVSWRDKLENIKHIVNGMDYKILVTVREPVSALFSYYVELYPRFSNRWESFSECALHDEDMEIFHYRKLLTKMFEIFDGDRIHVVKFEEIITPVPKETVLTHLSHHNKRKVKDDYVYSRHNRSIIDTVYQHFLDLGLGKTQAFTLIKKMGRPAVQLLDRLAFRRKIKIQRPSEDVLCFLREKLASETVALEERFGIKYG